MSDVLVTGGNGFVGRHLVEALQARGECVRVLALAGEDALALERRGVRVYRGDIRQPETLTAPMAGARAVVHLAAMMDVWRPLREYAVVNVLGTLNVCRAALIAGTERVVHMSTSSVYGMDLGHAADETFPLAPFPDPYPMTKAVADSAVQRMIREDGLRAVIVRPDQIFGPGDHLHFGRMADRLRAARSIVVGSGDNALPLVYISDVVGALLLAVDHPGAVGRAYNISAEQPLSQGEVLCGIADAIDARPPRLHVSYKLLYGAAYTAERLASLTRSTRRPPLTRLGVAFMGTDNRFSSLRARTELGYRTGVTIGEGLRLAGGWYCRSHGSVPPATSAAPPSGALSSAG